MTQLTDAISWSGSDVTLILFVVWPFEPGMPMLVGGGGTPPREVKSYRLEDPERHLGARVLYEYDLVYDRIPPDLQGILTSWLSEAITAGADAAWFGFEGSFDFEHLLTADIANQVFAVADRETRLLAVDDQERNSRAWIHELAPIRDRLLMP